MGNACVACLLGMARTAWALGGPQLEREFPGPSSQGLPTALGSLWMDSPEGSWESQWLLICSEWSLRGKGTVTSEWVMCMGLRVLRTMGRGWVCMRDHTVHRIPSLLVHTKWEAGIVTVTFSASSPGWGRPWWIEHWGKLAAQLLQAAPLQPDA